ncbi:MAG: glycosyltransferase [Oscillospiraceae bacterium]|nr:glycosyltransferase [Oscillospiraceae bacterium]
MNKLYAYLPCYNEAGNIEALVNNWLAESAGLQKRGYALEVVPVDDRSTDQTLDIIRRLELAHPEVRVIAHAVNKNLGGVLDTAVRDFLNIAGPDDLMCVMDGDNTHKPQYIFAMLSKLSNGRTGCVIASRYQKGAETTGVPGHRLLLSDCARLYYTVILHVPNVRDYTCGYRLYTQKALVRASEKYGEKLITRHTFSCMMELLYKLHKTGCKFAEVPFTLRYDDKAGASKMRILKTMADSLSTALRLRLNL